MKAAIGFVVVLALTLSAVPVIAGDTFRALSTLSAVEHARLTPLPDDQLAAIEGERSLNIAVQVAVVTQVNVCAVCKNVAQVNAAAVVQRARFR
jgi:hypothetical protein